MELDRVERMLKDLVSNTMLYTLKLLLLSVCTVVTTCSGEDCIMIVCTPIDIRKLAHILE